METCQVNRLSSRTKYGGRFNYSFAHNGGIENHGKQKYQGNTATQIDVVPG